MAKKSLVRSTGIIALSTLISRILGFVRDMVVASVFGATASLDGFFVAFRIPNLFRRLVGEGAFTISFIPVYTEYLETRTAKEALELAQKTFTFLLIVLFVLVGSGIVFSPAIVKLFAWGFTDQQVISLTVTLNRIMFPYLFMVSLVAFAMGYLNSHHHFFAPSFAPVLLNVGMITGALLFSRWFDEPLIGLAVGVLFGGLMQIILQIPYMVRHGFKLKLSLDLKHPGLRRMLVMLGPLLFSSAVYQINLLVNTLLASMLKEGSISYLYYSDRLTEIVLGIFIVSIGNAVLPEMSRCAAVNDSGRLRDIYTGSINAALFMAVPSAVALMTIGNPVVSVLFQRGAFSAFDSAMTAKALFWSCPGIIALAILRITVPVFYSMKNTLIPMAGSIAAFVVNGALGWFLMQTSLQHAGLSLSNAIAAMVQSALLLVFLRRKMGTMHALRVVLPLAKYIVCAVAMWALLYFGAQLVDWTRDPFWLRALGLGLLVTAGGGAYIALAWLLKVREVHVVLDTIKRKLRRRRA